MAKTVVFGITGYAGGLIATELAGRGHEVLGVARTVTASQAPVLTRSGSIHDPSLVHEVTAGADHVIVALPASATEEGGPKLIDALPVLVEAAVAAGARLSFVGGAGSLLVAEGGPALIDTPDFPDAFKKEGGAHAAVLTALQDSDEALDWFYLSPAATFGSWNAGERTGDFRLGGDILLVDDEGQSAISGADLAIAYVDEIESGRHPRSRFSVAY